MPVDPPQPGLRYVLMPPKDTTYPDAPRIVIAEDGTLHSNAGKLDYTIDDLNYGGRIYDWASGTVKQYRPTTTLTDTSTTSKEQGT